MSIILMIIGAFLLFGLLMLVITAISFWLAIMVSFFAFMVGGVLTAVIFHSGQGGFLLGGIGAVVLLWSVLIYNSNQADKDEK